MDKVYFLVLLTATVLLSGCAMGGGGTNEPVNNTPAKATVTNGLRICPDEKIIQMMPGPDGKSPDYYLVGGKRREVAEFDQDWVARNCKVKEQVTF